MVQEIVYIPENCKRVEIVKTVGGYPLFYSYYVMAVMGSVAYTAQILIKPTPEELQILKEQFHDWKECLPLVDPLDLGTIAAYVRE